MVFMGMTDYINQLGILALDHRLKRLMKQLLAAAEYVYEAQGVSFRARWMPTYMLLQQEGALSVTKLAERAEVTHPGMIQLTREMMKAGLVRQKKDKTDARKRLLTLTKKGKELAPSLVPIWEALRDAQAHVFEEAGCDILAVLGTVEEQLQAKKLSARVLERLEEVESVTEA